MMVLGTIHVLPSQALVDQLEAFLAAEEGLLSQTDATDGKRVLATMRAHLSRPAPCVLEGWRIAWTPAICAKRPVVGFSSDKLSLEMTLPNGDVVYVCAVQKLRDSHFGGIYEAVTAQPSSTGVLSPTDNEANLIIKEYKVDAATSHVNLSGHHVRESPLSEFKALQLLGTSHRNVLNLFACAEQAGVYYALFPKCDLSLLEYSARFHMLNPSHLFSNTPDARLYSGILLPPLNFLRRAIGQTSAGLAFVHSLGIVHRDLTIDNILVTMDQTANVVFKIIDFGLCKGLSLNPAGDGWLPVHMDTDSNHRPLGVGKGPYEAPETFRYRAGQPGPFLYDGPACDVWSMGMVVFRMLIGRYPFERASSDADYQRISLFVDKLSTVCVPGDPDFAALFHSLLALDPRQRPKAVEIPSHRFCISEG